jgi:rhodanese-related sulfurtransferase
MKLRNTLLMSAMAISISLAQPALALDVNITADLPSVEVMHNGKKIAIQRNQNLDNNISTHFNKTSRKCPPFCIQAGAMPEGVTTIGELEMLEFLKKAGTDNSVLIIDSRTPDWVERGTIPGAMNIPWDKLNIGKSDPFTVQDILENKLNVKTQDGFLNFNDAKTLVMFCNGAWCGQSPTNIKGLLKIGYPAHKLFWYRGGMQDWEMLGMTVVMPDGSVRK